MRPVSSSEKDMGRPGILLAAVSAVIGFAAGRCTDGANHTSDEISQSIVIVRDTVAISRPVATSSAKTGYIIRRAALTHTEAEIADTTSAITPDSVEVTLPVTTVTYTGPGYYARISGVEPRLDSIAVERTATTIIKQQRPRRWSIGVTAGIGVTPSGRIGPTVAVGLSWRLF